MEARPWEIPDRVKPELLSRYNSRVPRYTSYPTAPHFTDSIDRGLIEDHQRAALHGLDQLAFYIHVPFCRRKCLYCGCHSTECNDPSVVKDYTKLLVREMELTAALGKGQKIRRLMLGGGSPSELGQDGLKIVVQRLTSIWPLHPEAELSIELDPRTSEIPLLHFLLQMGFNRVSFGVQDFDPVVLERVGRVQPPNATQEAVAHLRRMAIKDRAALSINFDLLYGLPGQTESRWLDTLVKARELNPDRFAVFPYAHVPWMRPHQKMLERWGLPGTELRMTLFLGASRFLTEAGYEAVGMDHFARPSDELARASRQGTMFRDFMGYSAGPELDIVGLGASSISRIGGSYSQNHGDLEQYRQRIAASERPVHRGLVMTHEDKVRRQVIMTLCCSFRLDFSKVDPWLERPFEEHFEEEIVKLHALQEDGLLETRDRILEVTDMGRLFVRVICQAFDQYAFDSSGGPRHSTVV